MKNAFWWTFWNEKTDRNKIFTSLGIGPDTLMEFSTKTQSVDAMYSQKALINYQMNDKAKMEYDLLQDILNLCSGYY